MWTVYILLCNDSSLYTGITNDVNKRLEAHATGKGGAYTRSHLPVNIIYTEHHDSKSDALKREMEIKHWNRRQKISRLCLGIKP